MKGSSLTRGTVLRIGKALRKSLQSEEWSHKSGLLQRLDPRVKVLGLLALVIPAAWTLQFLTLAIVFAGALVLAALSKIPLAVLTKRAWLPVLLFTGAVALTGAIPGTRQQSGSTSATALEHLSARASLRRFFVVPRRGCGDSFRSFNPHHPMDPRTQSSSCTSSTGAFRGDSFDGLPLYPAVVANRSRTV